MASQTREVGRFVAVDDAGKSYTLVVYRDFVQMRDLSGGITERPGLPWVRTEDGDDVNCLSKGEYELLASGLRLHSSDPDAI